ncbi:unnamed protein product, partial [Mesorhabditis spiculigera]
MMLASQDLKCEPIGQPGDVEASSTSPPNIKPEPQVTTPINLSINNPINDFTSMFGAQLRQLAIFQQMQNQGEQHSAPAPPLFNNPEAMLNYFQAQMAKMQPPPMNNQPTRVVIAPQQSQNGERKRSYPMTFQWCELCQKEVHSSKLPCHIRQCHVAKPMFQCPQCDFTSTYSKNNVKSHMVSLHGLAGDPISYMDQYAGQVEEFMKRCFPHVRGRGRPIQGRTSPTSPGSSGNVSRRNSQATPPNRRPNPTFPTFDFSQAQSQLAAVLAARRCGDQPPIYGLPPLNPFLPVFPPGFPLPLGILNNNNIAHNMRKPTMNDGPMMTDPTENAVTLASTLGELLNKTNSTATARSPSPLSPGSNGSFTRPGENLQPKYTPIRIDCVVLNDDQIRPTIFNTLPPFSELLEKIEWKDSLSDAGKTRPVSPTHCLAIRNMREDLGHHLIDIFLAITGNFRNLQIEKLSHKSVQRLIEVAPSPVDALTFRTFESTYPNENLSDDEQFIVQMSRIERLEEKLHLLSWMTELREEAPRLMKELEVLHEARQAIASEHWRDMMQIVLVLFNMSLGDRSMASIKGDRCHAARQAF